MNDIIPPHKKRSIRDIPIPDKKTSSSNQKDTDAHRESEQSVQGIQYKKEPSDDLDLHQTVDDEHEEDFNEMEEEEVVHNKRSNRVRNTDFYQHNSKPKKIILAVVFVAILLFFIILAFRNGAEVTVEPKVAEATVATELQAYPDAREGSLSFTTDTVSIAVSETVTATGEEEVTEKASGKLTIYNSYSENSQRLITQTRFESPEGKIYRIQESVSVPGYTEDSAGEITPGTITVTVVADEAGESFNIDTTSFTIPGFAGQPQFDSMYAESETPMVGGFDGVRKFVEEDEKIRVENLLQEKAEVMLASEVSVINPDVYAFSTSSLESFVLEQESDGDDLTFTLQGEAKVVLFDKNAFANAIAVASMAAFDPSKEQVAIDMTDELSVTVTPQIATGSDRDVTSAIVSVDGTTSFLWDINTDELAESLAGTERKTFRNILESIPGIQKAEVTIRPFWKNSFPENAEKIEVIISADTRCDDTRC